MIPADLESSLLDFNRDLLAWLKRGGEERMLEFGPIESWHKVVKILSVRRLPAMGGMQ